MPIYEYKCDICGHVTEAWQKFSDPPLSACEVCGGAVKKIISANTFHLKGSGWYVTDYASGSSGHKTVKTEHNEKASKDEGKNDTKKAADTKEKEAS
jgi:putative FmdB family regulatory protein